MAEVTPGTGLDRRAVVAQLLRERGDLAVVTGLGSPAYDVMAAGDHDLNYYLWAAMGSACMVGLGFASAQPARPVLVVTGDGEALMGLGAFATIAVRQPANLTIVVLDNGHYGETGMQPSHTGLGIALDRVAAACGFPDVSVVADMTCVETVRKALAARSGLRFARILIRAEESPRVLPPRDGVYVKNRFRAALGFSPV